MEKRIFSFEMFRCSDSIFAKGTSQVFCSDFQSPTLLILSGSREAYDESCSRMRQWTAQKGQRILFVLFIVDTQIDASSKLPS